MNKLVYIPGYSKSYLHRFIILSWINDLDIVIKNFTPSDDVFATLNALYDSYKIIGGDLYLQKTDRVLRDEIYVGESGSTLRFLIPLMLLFQENKEITFKIKNILADDKAGKLTAVVTFTNSKDNATKDKTFTNSKFKKD